jgi:hypothetical protein
MLKIIEDLDNLYKFALELVFTMVVFTIIFGVLLIATYFCAVERFCITYNLLSVDAPTNHWIIAYSLVFIGLLCVCTIVVSLLGEAAQYSWSAWFAERFFIFCIICTPSVYNCIVFHMNDGIKVVALNGWS